MNDKIIKVNDRKYSKDYIECVFCGKSINLDSCNKHLNSKLFM